ncbi:MAG: M15 family metallopeptidase [Armatimonadia bacterium]
MKLNSASHARLRGVHPDLVRVVLRCAADWAEKDTGFIVTCGVRTLEEQKLLKAKGATRTLRSRHLVAANGYAHAVDLACSLNGQVRWDWPLYDRLAKAMKAAAKKEKVLLEWGGDWKTFKDGPHFQLPWVQYPGTKTGAKT